MDTALSTDRLAEAPPNADPVRTLLADATKLKDDTTQLQGKVAALEAGANSARQKLDIPVNIANKLRELDSTLGTTSQVLQVISIIPPIRAAASRAKMVVDTFAGPIRSASQAASSFAATVQPIRDAVAALQARLQQMKTQLGTVIGYEQTAIDGVDGASRCINALPAGQVKTRLSGTLDAAATQIDPPVVLASQQLANLLSVVNRIERNVNEMSNRLQALANISGAIDSVKSQLSVLLVPMQAVQSVLSQEISIPYGGYPEICYYTVLGVDVPYPCGWHTVYFSFSIKQILDGISGVIRPVMDLLESAMNAILNPLLSALHLDFSLPSIPGLSDLTNSLNVVKNAFNDLQQAVGGIAGSLTGLNTAIDQVRTLAAPVTNIYNDCKAQRH